VHAHAQLSTTKLQRAQPAQQHQLPADIAKDHAAQNTPQPAAGVVQVVEPAEEIAEGARAHAAVLHAQAVQVAGAVLRAEMAAGEYEDHHGGVVVGARGIEG